MEFQATHEPLYGFHLLWETEQRLHLKDLIQPVLLFLSQFQLSCTGCEWNSPCPAHTKTPANKKIRRTKRQASLSVQSSSRHRMSGGTGLSAHQTTVPLVFSDLLTQTVQLQLVDLQVRPSNTNPSSLLHFMVTSHLAAVHGEQHKQRRRCVYSL